MKKMTEVWTESHDQLLLLMGNKGIDRQIEEGIEAVCHEGNINAFHPYKEVIIVYLMTIFTGYIE